MENTKSILNAGPNNTAQEAFPWMATSPKDFVKANSMRINPNIDSSTFNILERQNTKINPSVLTNTDAYKLCHMRMVIGNVSYIVVYFQSRMGAKFPVQKFLGLQMILLQKFCKPFSYEEMLDLIKFSNESGTPVDEEKVRSLYEKYHGYLPIEIRAVPEGMILPIDNALMVIKNTDDEFEWVTNYIETELSHVWYPTYVATLSFMTRRKMKKYLEETSDDLGNLDWMHHNFGDRGTTCSEQSLIAGVAHLSAGAKGTDSVIGQYGVWRYYGGERVTAFSVAATEHSIMTQLGEAGEKTVFKFLLDKFNDVILSVVIDSYDYQRLISEYSAEFKEQIKNRKQKLVFRPDSGDPVEVSLDVYHRLAAVFGESVNSKGYKVLPPNIGILWGDGIRLDGMESILATFKANGIASSNIIFGQGGGLVQDCTRDSMRSAIKCCAQKRDDMWVDIQKNPLDSSKKSKAGRLKVIAIDGTYKTVRIDDPQYAEYEDIMVTVFRNGELLKAWTWDEILAWNDKV